MEPCLRGHYDSMGRDGAKELGSIRREGGRTLGQNEKAALYYGCPRLPMKCGHVMEQVSLADMAHELATGCRKELDYSRVFRSAPD